MPRTVTAQEVANKVRAYLKKEAPDFGVLFQIDVVDKDIRIEDEQYWFVPVMPEKQPKKTSDYYELLSEIEATMLMNEDIDVNLIPTLPE